MLPRQYLWVQTFLKQFVLQHYRFLPQLLVVKRIPLLLLLCHLPQLLVVKRIPLLLLLCHLIELIQSLIDYQLCKHLLHSSFHSHLLLEEEVVVAEAYLV